MLLLYAVTPPGAPLPEDLPVRRLTGDRVEVLFTDADVPPEADRSSVVAFGDALQRLAGTTPVLPVRFGTAVADLDELGELIRTREPEWQRRLDAVAGHVELVVHVDDDHESSPTARISAPRTGRDYLRVRVDAHRREEALVGGVRAALEEVARETRRLRARDGVRVAVLVPADRVDDVEARLGTWASARPGTRVRLTGPWPPFSFAEEA